MVDYFYTPPENISQGMVEIEGDEFNHLVHVMRKNVGDDICVVDGEGNAYDATLTSVKKKIAVGKITAHYRHHNEPALTVHLAVGVLKNPSKFDFLVEKVTEVGVQRIIPLSTERTIPKHAKVERWQKLALAAMKQCGRSVLPKVEQMQPLSNVLQHVGDYGLSIVCHESAGTAPALAEYLGRSSISNTSTILVLIGPEGGFSDEEVIACTKAGSDVAALGPRRLRTETAAVVAAGLVLSYELR
jgi:16S rRNA (uracil1498-N3)-methyltransferase